jgi:hypothetical protein
MFTGTSDTYERGGVMLFNKKVNLEKFISNATEWLLVITSVFATILAIFLIIIMRYYS